MGGVREVKPISCIEWVIFLIERNKISNIVICFKIQPLVFLYNIIRGKTIDGINIKFIHQLNPFKVIVTGLSSLFLSTLPFCIPLLCFFLTPCFYLTPTFHQRKEILTGPFGSIAICCHNYISNDFRRKVTNKI